jgi:hypothetical protein
MELLAPPVPRREIERELTDSSMIAEFQGLEIHFFHGPDKPSTLAEIGRVREQEYRRVGAGRGGAVDLDPFDTEWPWYQQLVSWDPDAGEIVAAYRAVRCDWALHHCGPDALRTNSLFEYGDAFLADYLPFTIELGRSVVNSGARKAVSGLFSVWVGLGAMIREWPATRYFFGNVSLYRSLPLDARQTIVRYLKRNHAPERPLVNARHRVSGIDAPAVAAPRVPGKQQSSGEPRSLDDLAATATAGGWSLPPILVSYLKANPSLLALGVAEDDDFGGAWEAAIIVPVENLSRRTIDRFVASYVPRNPDCFHLPKRAVTR